MLLSKLYLINGNIHKCREEIKVLTKSKGQSHPEVIKINAELDKNIIDLQRFILPSQNR